jgi:hypothetical protein
MTDRAVRLAAAAVCVVVVVAVALWLMRRPSPGPESEIGPAADFEFETVDLISPDVAVTLEVVRGTLRDGYTDWSCIFRCAEPDGCYGNVQVEIVYISGDQPRKLVLGGRIDGAAGAAMRVGRAQRPAPSVTRIDHVDLTVLDSFRPGDPTPTPME